MAQEENTAMIRTPRGYLRPLRDRSVRSALFAFLLTRSIILLMFILTTNLALNQTQSPYQPIDPYIRATPTSIAKGLRYVALLNDAYWYATIVQNRYEHVPFDTTKQRNWGFFPLHPLLWRFASTVTGEVPLTGMAMAHLLFLAALIILHRTALLYGQTQEGADRAVFYIAAFPTSYFFSLPWTESLFLCLTLATIYAARRDLWWTAGVLASLTSATRFLGIFIAPVLFVIYWQRYRTRPRGNALSLLLCPIGILAFSWYLYSATGNPFAYKDIQQAQWGHMDVMFFLSPLYKFGVNWHEIAIPWNFIGLNCAVAVIGLSCNIVLLMRREWALALYALGSELFALSSIGLQAHARYTMVLFPIFIVLATIGRSRWLDQAIRTVFIAFLGVMSALFSANITFAGN